MLTPDLLEKIAPFCKHPKVWAKPLSEAMSEWSINTRGRVCAFLAQILHESHSLNEVEENLSYSGMRLMQVWPKRFPTYDSTRPYIFAPQKLANLVYGDRLGNRGVESDDGWAYRGRGPMMITGLNNYVRLAELLRLPLVANPGMLIYPQVGSAAAAAFWQDHGLNEMADVITDNSFLNITAKINSGLLGLKARRAFWETAKKEIKEWPAPGPNPISAS